MSDEVLPEGIVKTLSPSVSGLGVGGYLYRIQPLSFPTTFEWDFVYRAGRRGHAMSSVLIEVLYSDQSTPEWISLQPPLRDADFDSVEAIASRQLPDAAKRRIVILPGRFVSILFRVTEGGVDNQVFSTYLVRR